MYIKNALILNSGSLIDLEITFEFNDDGTPKPTLIVGRNGAGKSNFLSFITDALIELAATQFIDVAPRYLVGHRWHRIVGGSTIRAGSTYELALVRFLFDSGNPLTYISKAGQVSPQDVKHRLTSFPENLQWPEHGNHKTVVIGNQQQEIARIFREGCFASFPSNRAERPYWANIEADDESSVFQERYENRLEKPIAIMTALPDIKPWLVDVIMDQMIDGAWLASPVPSSVPEHYLQQRVALENFNNLLKEILKMPSARLVRAGRAAGNRKLQVFDGQLPLFPSLDSLSFGQATLLSIFSTVLRYADAGPVANRTDHMRGIVLIDEADAHLHADLLFEVFPRLIRLFPKIQFILTAHAPLLPLGMEREFGERGFNLIELPEGTNISAERFSEFLRSFELLKETQAFEKTLAQRVSALQRPLVLCEGETDAKYLSTAAELLGFERLSTKVDFDWVGVMANGRARDGGENQLRQAQKTLRNNPVFLKMPTVLLFDCDVQCPNLDEGDLHVRVLEKNTANNQCNKGVENILPEMVFEDRFFDTKIHQDGPNTTTKKQLDKVKLCDYLCDEKRVAHDFEGFRTALVMLDRVFWPVELDG